MKAFAKMTWVLETQKTKRLFGKKKYKEALVAAEKSYKLAVDTFGKDFATTIKTRYNLVLLNIKMGNLQIAEEHARGALIDMEKLQGNNHRKIVEEIKALEEVYREMGEQEKVDILENRVEDIIEGKQMKSTAELIQWDMEAAIEELDEGKSANDQEEIEESCDDGECECGE